MSDDFSLEQPAGLHIAGVGQNLDVQMATHSLLRDQGLFMTPTGPSTRGPGNL